MWLAIVTIGEPSDGVQEHYAVQIGAVASSANETSHDSRGVTVVVFQQAAEARLALDETGGGWRVVLVRRLIDVGHLQERFISE